MILSKRLDEFQDTLFHTEGIPLWVYSNDWILLDSNCPWENELRNIFFLGKNMDRANDYFQGKEKCIYLSDDFGLEWIAVAYKEDDKILQIYVIGPTLSMEVSEQILREQMNMQNMSVASQIKFLNLSATIPVVPRSFFFRLGGMLFYTIYKETMDIETLYSNGPTSSQERNDITVTHSKFHGSYLYELAILQEVEKGNINYRANRAQMKDMTITGTMSPGNPLRQHKDELIVYTALVTRAAMRGGMHPETAYNLSDYYIQRLEATNHITELYPIGEQMYDDFIHRVHALQQKPTYSAAVSDCLHMIKARVSDSVDIKTIAEALGYSPYYLTRQIKNETGKFFKDIVKEEKINYAKIQLMDPYISIASISEQLHFSSPSHFSSQFRHETRMTPKEYREQGLRNCDFP
jgi:AraC-like DNA-binding protein